MDALEALKHEVESVRSAGGKIRFPDDLRAKILAFVDLSNRTAKDISDDLGLAQSLLCTWRNHLSQGAVDEAKSFLISAYPNENLTEPPQVVEACQDESECQEGSVCAGDIALEVHCPSGVVIRIFK